MIELTPVFIIPYASPSFATWHFWQAPQNYCGNLEQRLKSDLYAICEWLQNTIIFVAGKFDIPSIRLYPGYNLSDLYPSLFRATGYSDNCNRFGDFASLRTQQQQKIFLIHQLIWKQVSSIMSFNDFSTHISRKRIIVLMASELHNLCIYWLYITFRSRSFPLQVTSGDLV